MRVFLLRAGVTVWLVAGQAGEGLAQTALPMTPPPKFPAAAVFNPKAHPASARQHDTMVRIPGGAYTIGSPAQHHLANRAAMPQHRMTIGPFRIDRTEVTNGSDRKINPPAIPPRRTRAPGASARVLARCA